MWRCAGLPAGDKSTVINTKLGNHYVCKWSPSAIWTMTIHGAALARQCTCEDVVGGIQEIRTNVTVAGTAVVTLAKRNATCSPIAVIHATGRIARFLVNVRIGIWITVLGGVPTRRFSPAFPSALSSRLPRPAYFRWRASRCGTRAGALHAGW